MPRAILVHKVLWDQRGLKARRVRRGQPVRTAMLVHKVLWDHRDLKARRVRRGQPVRTAMPVHKVLWDQRGPKARRVRLVQWDRKACKVLLAADCTSWSVRRLFPVVRMRL
ncbi:MAG: hypothetical protein ACLQU2_14365 [Candidatus Binataceae bacterium]